ncbi:uncharacterized protein LOC133298881 [Gastrolobium bilobum]|uniref:uncharacterized protein LOC133298881 n=1 Tax=Gastrolobium bilobum TaxID=150636 RepID=UPI002AB1D3A0|nr:uncharacterized protein LOC133298881 [Gastrolobium bilobum]
MAGRRRSSSTGNERRQKLRQDRPSSSRPQEEDPAAVDLPFGYLFENDPVVHESFVRDFVNRPICGAKSLDTALFEQEGFNIVRWLEESHLRTLAELSCSYSELHVRAFYHNLSYHQGELRSRVCGVDIYRDVQKGNERFRHIQGRFKGVEDRLARLELGRGQQIEDVAGQGADVSDEDDEETASEED